MNGVSLINLKQLDFLLDTRSWEVLHFLYIGILKTDCPTFIMVSQIINLYRSSTHCMNHAKRLVAPNCQRKKLLQHSHAQLQRPDNFFFLHLNGIHNLWEFQHCFFSSSSQSLRSYKASLRTRHVGPLLRRQCFAAHCGAHTGVGTSPALVRS